MYSPEDMSSNLGTRNYRNPNSRQEDMSFFPRQPGEAVPPQQVPPADSFYYYPNSGVSQGYGNPSQFGDRMPNINYNPPPYNTQQAMPGMITPGPPGMIPPGPPGMISPGAPGMIPPGVSGMMPPGASYLSDPLLANMAMQYGTKMVGSGKEMVGREIEKYVALSSLKYYFAVDTAYVLRKLKLLLFPYNHHDWSLKYSQNEPLQPRHDVNACDLYIPTMAYVTYVLVAGLVLGTQNKFSPEMLGILASQALAWTFVEVVIQLATLYVTNIQYNMRTLDVVAFSGYKFVGIILSILVSLVFDMKGYIIMVLYTSLTLAFFMVRTLKFQMLAEKDPGNLDNGYENPSKLVYGTGNKRKMYFMLSVGVCQPILMWWLSYHLVSKSV